MELVNYVQQDRYKFKTFWKPLQPLQQITLARSTIQSQKVLAMISSLRNNLHQLRLFCLKEFDPIMNGAKNRSHMCCAGVSALYRTIGYA